jgi:P-type Ca2+ transporter type 2C
LWCFGFVVAAFGFVVAAKGAPEAIAGLCRLNEAEISGLRETVNAMAIQGLRVLGVAMAAHGGKSLPELQSAFSFVFLGLVGLADPLRASVPLAVRECGSAGIRVIMITGDYPATARAIAQQAGLDAAQVTTGEELERLNATELSRRVTVTNVFACIMAGQKLRIVQALKAIGEIVAMTGADAIGRNRE